MADCLFCKIIAGEIPSTRVFENDKVVAIKDISPQAPIHILVMPKAHIESLDDITSQNSSFVAAIAEAIAEIAKEQGLTNGYRVVTNIGEDGAQSVKHLHFHLLGGKRFSERFE